MRVDRELQQLLAQEVRAILAGWTGADVTRRYGWHPSRVSELRRGDLSRFSIGRLVNLLAELYYDVEVTVRPSPIPPRVFRRAAVRVTRLIS